MNDGSPPFLIPPLFLSSQPSQLSHPFACKAWRCDSCDSCDDTSRTFQTDHALSGAALPILRHGDAALAQQGLHAAQGVGEFVGVAREAVRVGGEAGGGQAQGAQQVGGGALPWALRCQQCKVRISEEPDSVFAKSRTAVSVTPGQSGPVDRCTAVIHPG